MTRGYNLPDNVSPSDPNAPWNLVGGDDEPEEEVEEVEEGAVCPAEDCGWSGSYSEADFNGSDYECPVCGGPVVDASDTDPTFEIED